MSYLFSSCKASNFKGYVDSFGLVAIVIATGSVLDLFSGISLIISSTNISGCIVLELEILLFFSGAT